MQCGNCHFDNVPGASRCAECGRALNADATVTDAALHATRTEAPATFATPGKTVSLSEVIPGTIIGERYEILKLLGEGGMGVVYGARDREVDRVVALKVIRPEFANRAEILSRFKHELILARQITHKNVIRIFDFGQADGIKFITMELVEGADLRSVLKNHRAMTIEEKVKIATQICLALDAAHSEGVVHRDLKPHNIVIENSGRVVVMDFGIARSLEDTGGMTSTGAILGTPAYMSPEQAKGEKLDTRSDLFSFGIVFYELLTGKAPYEAETVMGLLLKRVQEKPIPPVERNPGVPQALSDVVLKCLAVDREQRYQSAREIVQDLEGWLGAPGTFRTVMTTPAAGDRVGITPEGQAIVTPGMMMMAQSNTWKWITLSLAALAVVVGGVFGAMRFVSKPAGPHAPVTVLVADFNNHTGDPIFDGTLEATLKLALEGAGFISAYDRTQLGSLGVPAVSGRFDEQAATKIALSQGLRVVVSGSLDRQGTGYGLSLRAIQAVTGNALASSQGNAANKDQVLFTVSKVAAPIRKALGDSTSETEQLFAMETLSAASLEAVHDYALAMDAISRQQNDEARRNASKALDLDPNFGLAYTVLASASRNLGKLQDAEKYIKEANKHLDRMTERERYRTRGFYYLLTGDQQKCVEEYGGLVAKYSSDVPAHNNLGICYSNLRNMPKAIDETQRAIDILPKRASYRFNLSFYQSLAGDFQTAERTASSAIQMDPSSERGYFFLAFAQLGQDHFAQAAESYRKLESLSSGGASIAAGGLADIEMYAGRFANAVKILEEAAAADLAKGDPDRAADKFAALAYTQLLREQKALAVAAAKRALDNSKSVKIRFLAAQIFVACGEIDKATELSKGLSSELPAEPQAYGKLIEGEIALKQGDARQAIGALKQGNNLFNTWMGRFDLGRAYLAANALPEADSEFDFCIKHRPEAISLFIEDVPTYGYFPPVYYYLGRVREAQNTSSFADWYRRYLSIREQAGEDPLLPEVRRRAGNKQ